MSEYIKKELVEGITNALGDVVISIILYGSVARGTDMENSDVDIANKNGKKKIFYEQL